MKFVMPTDYRNTMYNGLTKMFKGTDVKVEFFKGDLPTNEEMLNMKSIDKTANKLGEVTVSLDVAGLMAKENEFTPTENGDCTWARFADTTNPELLVTVGSNLISKDQSQAYTIELDSLTFDKTVKNILKQFIVNFK